MEESRFHKELDRLKMKVLQMAALTEKALGRALQALFERNSDLAQQVIDKDHDVDSLEVEIDRLILRLLALGQPVARDLRFIVGCMRVSVNLERLGDQAVNIAERAIQLNQRPALAPQPLLEQLAAISLDMFRKSISAFVEGDVDLAMEVCRMDDRADDLNVKILRDSVDYMVSEVRVVERSVLIIIISRCLERIGDHATNICEASIFIVKGVDIKHHSA
jgi:phosphate transport system protein